MVVVSLGRRAAHGTGRRKVKTKTKTGHGHGHGSRHALLPCAFFIFIFIFNFFIFSILSHFSLFRAFCRLLEVRLVQVYGCVVWMYCMGVQYMMAFHFISVSQSHFGGNLGWCGHGVLHTVQSAKLFERSRLNVVVINSH